jgi:hypothetical protein
LSVLWRNTIDIPDSFSQSDTNSDHYGGKNS